MDGLGWTIAGMLAIFLAGLLVGLNVMSRRHITVNQSVSQSVEHTVNGGGSGSSNVLRAAPPIFPIMAIGAVVALAVMLAQSGITATNAVADTAARGIEVQRETMHLIPTSAPPVIVQQPAPIVVTHPSIGQPALADVVAVVSLIIAAISCGVVVYAVRRNHTMREQRLNALYASPTMQAPMLSAREVFGEVDNVTQEGKT